MFVIMVDAGFLLAGAAQRINGNPIREKIVVDHGRLVAGLITTANSGTNREFLRLYWYDASHTGQIDADQAKIAELPGTKVRLGRLVRGVQKGVDSRIIADMMRMAWRKAADHIFLISGDEDIVEGVEEAQSHGCRVTLIGIKGIAQSQMLIHAADEVMTLDDEVLTDCITSNGSEVVNAIRAGEEFARGWLLSADPEVVQTLLSQESMAIPSDIDAQLIKSADIVLGGVLRGQPTLRESVRAGFWSVLESKR